MVGNGVAARVPGIKIVTIVGDVEVEGGGEVVDEDGAEGALVIGGGGGVRG